MSNIANEDKDIAKEVFHKIGENYDYLNEMMVNEMELSSKHNVLTGNYREEMWLKFFRNIIPRKFSLEQGVMIIDSKGNISKEVDIAVFDEQYTPYVFRYNSLKFIPIEAVSLVIECKSSSVPIENLEKWAKSINDLETSSEGIARIVSGYVTGYTNTSQQGTQPIKILCCIKSNKNKQPSFVEKLSGCFDFIVYEDNNKRFVVKVNNKDNTLGWWANKLNSKIDTNKNEKLSITSNKKLIEEVKKNEKCSDEVEDGILYGNLKFSYIKNDKEDPKCRRSEYNLYITNKLSDLEIPGNPLLSLNLQINQLLMLVNNPMLFPHFAYANIFKKYN